MKNRTAKCFCPKCQAGLSVLDVVAISLMVQQLFVEDSTNRLCSLHYTKGVLQLWRGQKDGIAVQGFGPGRDGRGLADVAEFTVVAAQSELCSLRNLSGTLRSLGVEHRRLIAGLTNEHRHRACALAAGPASPCSASWTEAPRPSPPRGEGQPWRLKRHGRVRQDRRQSNQGYARGNLFAFKYRDLQND